MLRRTLLLISALAVLVLAASSDVVHGLASGAVEAASGVVAQRPLLGVAVFVALSGASAMLAFFSTVPLVPVAVEAWGQWPSFFLLWLAWILGGIVSWVLGRFLGPRVAHWFVEPGTVERYASRLERRAGLLSILVFQLAVPSEIPGYVLGTLRYSFRIYLAALVLAELPYALSSVFLSEGFLRREYTVLVLVGMAAIALSALAWRALRKRFGDDAVGDPPG